MRTTGCFVCAVVAMMPWSSASRAGGDTITDDKFHFSMTIPAELRTDPALADTNPNLIHGFRMATPGEIDTVILLERLHGTIGPKRLDRSNLPAGSTGKIVTMFWQGYQLDATEIPDELSGIPIITYNIRIPLKLEAIQLGVAGSREQREQVRQLAESLLAGLRGESNWGAPVAPPESSESFAGSYPLLTFALGIVVVGMISLWFLRLYTPRGFVFKVSIAILILHWFLPAVYGRQQAAFMGALLLLGWLGSAFGVYDLCRKRSPRNDPLRRSDKPLAYRSDNPV